MDIYCTRPGCAKPINSFPDLDTGGTIKTIAQKFCTHCGMPLILAGRYLTEKPLARGGFGATYTAKDRYTPAMKRCVVKQLLPTGLTSQQMAIAKQMFEREGAVLEELGGHPQIPDLLAFFEIQVPMGQAGKAEDFFYLVQEFIDGFTLEQIVEQHGAVAENDVVEIMNSLLPVLQFVHDRGSIHRDIKPSNIMIRKQDERYFLLDFGAVKQIAAVAANQKSTGIFTPGFGAPEQMRGGTVFPSTDLYAFAVTCICLLTGKPPEELFDANTNKWNWRSQVRVSDRLANILNRMLETNPSDRYASAQAVLDALGSVNIASVPLRSPISTARTPAPSPGPQPIASVAPARSSAPVSQSSPGSVTTPWVTSVPLGKQTIAAFSIGFEAMALGNLAYHVGFQQIGQLPSTMILAGAILSILWLRVSQVLDNKDLLVFVNAGTILLLFCGQIFWQLTIPPIPTLLLLSAIAGFSAVALMTLFRLIFQILYSLF